MPELLKFLIKYEIWGYALLGVIGIIYFQKFIKALSELRSAVYGLEREAAQRHISSALTVLVLLGLIGAAQFTLVTFVVPIYPWESQLPTPTINVLATPTPTLKALPGLLTTTPLVPSATPEIATGCIPGKIEWTFPKSGGQISGTVELKGTVKVDNLGFYKYEYSQAGSNTWVTIAAGNIAIIDQPLGGSWNTSQLPAGDYLLRLVVTDNKNQLFPACVIPVRIVTK